MREPILHIFISFPRPVAPPPADAHTRPACVRVCTDSFCIGQDDGGSFFGGGGEEGYQATRLPGYHGSHVWEGADGSVLCVVDNEILSCGKGIGNSVAWSSPCVVTGCGRAGDVRE